MNGIKSLGNIKFDQQGWDVRSVEISCEVANIHEVVMDCSLFDEDTLVVGD
jgi:hypothetical protein